MISFLSLPGWVLVIPRFENCWVSGPLVKGTPLRCVSFGFAALTLDHRSSDHMRAGYRGMPSCGLLASARHVPVKTRQSGWSVGVAERLIHSPCDCLRRLVLAAPAEPFPHRVQYHPGVDGRVGLAVGPHEPRTAIH